MYIFIFLEKNLVIRMCNFYSWYRGEEGCGSLNFMYLAHLRDRGDSFLFDVWVVIF